MYYPYLVINYEKRAKRVPRGIYVDINRCNLVVVKSESMSQRLDCAPEDVMEFFYKLYSTSFSMNIVGEGTANILEYRWFKNILFIYSRRSEEPISIELSMENIKDIQEICKPSLSDTPFSEWGKCILC